MEPHTQECLENMSTACECRTFDDIRLRIEDIDPQTLLADGLEKAIIGFGMQSHRYLVVYSKKKVIEVLMERDRMTVEEALEFFEYNIVGAYVGPYTPVFLDDWL